MGTSRRLALFHDLTPVFHFLLRLLEAASIPFACEPGQQFAEDAATVAHQSDINGKSETDPFGIKFDRYALGIARLWASIRGRGKKFRP
jgi:hypothetical protein